MVLKKSAVLVLGIGWLALICACGGGGSEETNQVEVEKPPSSESPSTQDPKDGDALDQWIDHTKAAQQGDFRVSILGASIGKTDLKTLFGDPASSSDPHLQIRLRIENLGNSRKVTFRGWGVEQLDFDTSEAADLEDEIGNSYRRIHFGTSKVVGQVKHESLYPGKSLTDVVVFEPPVPAAKELHLTLPARAFDGEGMLRFRIPMTAIRGAKISQEPPAPRISKQPDPESKSKETATPQNPKPKPQQTTNLKPKPEPKTEPEPKKEDPEELEKKAAGKLRLADKFYDNKKFSDAKSWYQDIVRDYPGTEAAKAAQKKLDAMP